MLVNKISNFNKSFTGYQHSLDNFGCPTYTINYPHDNSIQATCKIYKTVPSDKDSCGYKIQGDYLKEYPIESNGAVINVMDIPELTNNTNPIAYGIFINGKKVTDTGLATKDGYNIINRNGTSPLIQGQAILTMPDIHRIGAYYADFNSPNTGQVVYDKNLQSKNEHNISSAATKHKGSLAGLEYDIDYLKSLGIKKIFSTPIWGGDNVSGHHYWIKNNMQISEDLGNTENYETFIRKLFKNGMQYVDDIALTSEGLEGIHAQYALRWADRDTQTKYWFRMNSLDEQPISLGIAPKDNQNLRHQVINPSVMYNEQTNRVEKNPNYDASKETYFQIYDISLAKEVVENQPVVHDSQKIQNPLSINTSKDTIVNYKFEIDPKDYENRLNDFVDYNKHTGKKIKLNSPEGTIFIGQFPGFKISNEAEGAVFWDANNDMLKLNHKISGYDEKLIQAKTTSEEKNWLRKLIETANYEVQDLSIQTGVYRTKLVKDIQTIYVAQLIQKLTSAEDINKLINQGLPNEALLNDEEVSNILDDLYNIDPKGTNKNKDDITLKALMELPLDSLELGENTTGVLSTSFFSNRADQKDLIGTTRFEMYKQGLSYKEPYRSVYNQVTKLFTNDLKDFTDEVIKKLNNSSQEKLLDNNGNYTEYGEYIIDLFGKDIAKYAFLKAIAGDKLKSKIMSDDTLSGKITYDYNDLKNNTTLKALGIHGNSPEDEAMQLFKTIKSGFNKLSNNDIDYIASSISKRISGTNANSFKLATAIVKKSGLGLDFRLDAAKDIADMDSVRNRDLSFDNAWDSIIDFWKAFVENIKNINPNSYIVAEITDIDVLMSSIYGQNTNTYERADSAITNAKYKSQQDANKAFFEQTGITSETGYAYTFTDLLKIFSAEFETGTIANNATENFVNRLKHMLQAGNNDYIRNMWTFSDNHDKPSVIHGMALDMGLFYGDIEYSFNNENIDTEYDKIKRSHRFDILKELTNSDTIKELPLEAILNVDNSEYFMTANTRATAMSKLLRSCINETISDNHIKETLKSALVDLTNGNYLNNNKNIDIQTIKIPELQSLENALEYILSDAHIKLSEQDKTNILKYASSETVLSKYTIKGDFDWAEPNWVGKLNQDRAKSVLDSKEWDFMQYSPYTVSVAALLLEAYKNTMGDSNITQFINADRNFIHRFNREYVKQHSQRLNHLENPDITNKRNGYATKDFETIIEMLISQAEYNSGTKFSKQTHDMILENLFKASTEPAIQKALMYSAFLSALPGIPSIYLRDILGGLGFDEKAKNVYLQNRNPICWSELDEGPLKTYRKAILSKFEEIISLRAMNGTDAINKGTPYILETNNANVPALLYQDGKDNLVITILNTTGIMQENKISYVKSAEVDTINNKNPYVPYSNNVELDNILLPGAITLTAGTVFTDIFDKNKTKYVVKKFKDATYRLVSEDGGKIILNGNTTKNGIMMLKKVSFRGSAFNQQFNITPNIYEKTPKQDTGKILSIISV